MGDQEDSQSFVVEAIKSYKPTPDTPNFETLLTFKRKQIITVLDWDQKRDAVFGEYDGKRGWFPASYGKIISTKPNSKSPRQAPSITVSPETPISPAASIRNSVPINPVLRRQHSSPTIKIVSPTITPPESPSTGPSPRRLGIIGSSISAVLSKADGGSSDNTSTYNSLKNSKLCSNKGVPLLVVNIAEFIRNSDIIYQANLFKQVGKEVQGQSLEQQFDNERVNLASEHPTTIMSCLKQYLNNLDEPLLTFDLFESFTAAVEINEVERRIAHFHYLLDLLPPQYYNVASYISTFFANCIEHASKNDFTMEDASRMFSGLYCRTHSLHTLSEVEIQKASQVTSFLLEYHSSLFVEEGKNILDKKAERSIESRRKKEKDTMSSYHKNESKRVKKEEKKNKKRSKTISEPLHVPMIPQDPESVEKMTEDVKLRKRANSDVIPPLSPSSSPKNMVVDNIQSREISNVQSDPRLKRMEILARFYQIGFYSMLLVFVISHCLRSVL